MMWKIEKELLKATRQRAKATKENEHEYLERIVRGVSRLSDKAFYRLSPEAQAWATSETRAFNRDDRIRRYPRAKKPLVQKHLEKIHCDVLREAPEIISDFINGRNGVYALYNQEGLYYVGLATNLMRRLLDHLEDSHRENWDRFSIYLTGAEVRKDLETLMIHIAKPPGCKSRGKFVDSDNLSKQVNANFRRWKKDQHGRWFGSHDA